MRHIWLESHIYKKIQKIKNLLAVQYDISLLGKKFISKYWEYKFLLSSSLLTETLKLLETFIDLITFWFKHVANTKWSLRLYYFSDAIVRLK